MAGTKNAQLALSEDGASLALALRVLLGALTVRLISDGLTTALRDRMLRRSLPEEGMLFGVLSMTLGLAATVACVFGAWQVAAATGEARVRRFAHAATLLGIATLVIGMLAHVVVQYAAWSSTPPWVRSLVLPTVAAQTLVPAAASVALLYTLARVRGDAPPWVTRGVALIVLLPSLTVGVAQLSAVPYRFAPPLAAVLRNAGYVSQAAIVLLAYRGSRRVGVAVRGAKHPSAPALPGLQLARVALIFMLGTGAAAVALMATSWQLGVSTYSEIVIAWLPGTIVGLSWMMGAGIYRVSLSAHAQVRKLGRRSAWLFLATGFTQSACVSLLAYGYDRPSLRKLHWWFNPDFLLGSAHLLLVLSLVSLLMTVAYLARQQRKPDVVVRILGVRDLALAVAAGDFILRMARHFELDRDASSLFLAAAVLVGALGVFVCWRVVRVLREAIEMVV